ncbi:hypothetical protein [Ruegeria sp. THAF57]|nr:hypothetical protein [Ruegeria sp. THAF57]
MSRAPRKPTAKPAPAKPVAKKPTRKSVPPKPRPHLGVPNLDVWPD